MAVNEIVIQGQRIAYTVRYSKRARRVNLKIDFSKGLEVIVPAEMKLANLEPVLRRHEKWILKHIGKVDPISSRQYIDGETIFYLGDEYMLRLMPDVNKSRVTLQLDGEYMRVKLPVGLAEAERAAVIRDALIAWYRRQAKQYIPPRVAELAHQHGFQYKKISIRGQKTRWGSCSNLGNLNFNWGLMMTPPEAIDYLIIHELCHLRELNHSQRFWDLVASLFPDYSYWRQWLKDNTTLLQL